LGSLFICNTSEAKKAGFGMSKLTVELERERPPDVYITGARIDIRPSALSKSDSAERQLIGSLQSELPGNDPRLAIDATRPQTVIEVAILANEVKERWETRKVSRLVKVGTDSKGKDKYGAREVSVRFKVVTQVFNVSYSVRDLRSGAVLDADTFDFSSDNDYEEGKDAPDASWLVSSAVKATVAEIASRVTPTRESVGVLLPKGNLNDFNNLAKAALWNRYLEALESLPQETDPRSESYRQYALGVAYEALAYSAEANEIAISYLEESSMHYNEAIQTNPDEKFFTVPYKAKGFLAEVRSFVSSSSAPRPAMAPLERVRSALAQYQKIVDFADSQEVDVASGTGAKALSGDEPADQVLNNGAIIEMAEAGLPDEIILTSLESATATDFDVSPASLIDLAKAQVSPQVIQRIQALAAQKN
jgi:hypothetical protein